MFPVPQLKYSIFAVALLIGLPTGLAARAAMTVLPAPVGKAIS